MNVVIEQGRQAPERAGETLEASDLDTLALSLEKDRLYWVLDDFPSGTVGWTKLDLSAEQKAELDRFGAERSRIRRELRAVKLDLNRDIEALGRNVKLFNIVAWPLLVAGLALLYPAWRKRRNAAIRMLEQGRTAGTQAP